MSTDTVSDDALPLTTIFTPPASCSSHWTYEASFYNSVSGGLLIQNALESPLDTACFPSGFDNFGRSSGSQIYTPGQCPVGYTAPAQYVNGPTTTLVCCQSSFSYFSTLTTIDNIHPPTSLIFAGCISTYPKASGATTVIARQSDNDLATTSVLGPISMWGQPVQVAFQQSDLKLYPATSTSSSSSSSSSSTAQPSSSPSTPPTATSGVPLLPSTSPPPTTSLSTGAKAGIGVGASLVGLCLVGIAIFFVVKRRRREMGKTSVEQPTKISGHVKEDKTPWPEKGPIYTPLDPVEIGSGAIGTELGSTARVELPERRESRPVELDSTHASSRKTSTK